MKATVGKQRLLQKEGGSTNKTVACNVYLSLCLSKEAVWHFWRSMFLVNRRSECKQIYCSSRNVKLVNF